MAARTPRSSAASQSKPSAAKAAKPEVVEEVVVEETTVVVEETTVEPVVAPAAPAAPSSPSPSVLERLRRNRMGAVLGGLVVAMVVGLLLSIFVPDSNLLLALAVLGLAEAFAVGFTVRYLSECRGRATQLTAFVLAALGVHVLVTTGMVNQAIGDLGSVVGGLLNQGAGAPAGLGWDDAVISALATPAISTGTVVCGLVAAIIAGWGLRSESGHGRGADAA